jgi:hypothetical protein
MTLHQGFLKDRGDGEVDLVERLLDVWSFGVSLLHQRQGVLSNRPPDDQDTSATRTLSIVPSTASIAKCVTEVTLMVLPPWGPSPSRARSCLPRRHVPTRHGDRSLSKGDSFGSPAPPLAMELVTLSPGANRLGPRWPCHSRAISEGQSRYRADNHGHCYPTAELAVPRSTSMNASREYA